MNYSIPIYLSDFSTLDNKRTIAKLKMFYVGVTGDGREFTKEFSEKILKSLPYCPVVGFFSDLKNDFLGHNPTQYIYGIVPPDAKHNFEIDESGVEWFITEVLLYTDRIDNIGEVARKIVGHKQSLEMDPETVEYEVIKEGGKSKVRFKNANLIGLSVLGENEKPAFAGSEFFVDDEELRGRFENFFSFLTNKGGALMENQELFAQHANFIRLTYQDKERMVEEEAIKQGIYGCVVEMADDYAVLEVWEEEQCTVGYYMYDYTIDEQGVKLENERKCLRRFIPVAEIKVEEEKVEEEDVYVENVDDKEQYSEEEIVEAETVVEEEVEFAKDDKEEEEAKCADKDEEEEAKCAEEEAKCAEEEVVECAKKEEEETHCVEEEIQSFTEEGESHEQEETNFENEKKGEENFASSATELTNSEREELETYRLKERLSLVDTYKDDFSADMMLSFKEMAKSLSYEELEAKLAIEFRKISKSTINKNDAAIFSFSQMVVENQTKNQGSYADLVRAVLRK